jgi:CII-binding regulator of phage lambda lysogenization HflD
MNKLTLELGIGRQALARLTQSAGLLQRINDSKIVIPAARTVTLQVSDEVDGKALTAQIGELQALVDGLAGMVAEMFGEQAASAESAASMVSMEDAKKMVAQKETELEEAKAQLATASKATDSVKLERDSLLRELAPLRANELVALRTEAVAFGIPEAQVKDVADAGTIRRIVVAAQLGPNYSAKTATKTADGKDAEVFEHADETISGAYAGLKLGRDAAAAAAKPPAQAAGAAGAGASPTTPTPAPAAQPARDTQAPFAKVPPVTPTQDAKPPAATGPKSPAETVSAQMDSGFASFGA